MMVRLNVNGTSIGKINSVLNSVLNLAWKAEEK